VVGGARAVGLALELEGKHAEHSNMAPAIGLADQGWRGGGGGNAIDATEAHLVERGPANKPVDGRAKVHFHAVPAAVATAALVVVEVDGLIRAPSVLAHVPGHAPVR
jgi:hypothetical protein